MVNIAGLSKAAVLAALYNGAKAQGLGFLHYTPEPMTEEQAAKLLEHAVYFDYLQGRVMKIAIEGDELDTWGYDRDNGQGAAEHIIAALRATSDVNPEEAERLSLENTRKAAQDIAAKLNEESTMQQTGDVATLTLGLDDVADQLKPRLDDILGEDDE